MTKLMIESGRGLDTLSVRIRDEVSGTTLASFNLTPEEIWKMLGGTTLDVEGDVSSYLDRVGKTMTTDSVTLDWKSGDFRRGDAPLTEAETSVMEAHPEWDTYNARYQNGGRITVIMRRWDDAPSN